MNLRKLVTVSVLTALSVALVATIRFPFPPAPYLEYDPADIPILLVTFAFGPLTGVLMTAVVSVVQGLTVSAKSGVYGIIMHIIATSTLVLTAGGVYNLKRDRIGALIGVVLGTLAMTAVMIPANLIITPLFLGSKVGAELLLTVIIPFNLIKAGANGTVAYLIYAPLKGFIENGRAGAVIGRRHRG